MDYQTPQWDKIFRNLLVDIRDQQCVLLLGPEIIRKGNISLTHFMYESLKENDSDENIAHFYAKDGFFLFNEGGKEEIQREVKLFYEKQRLGQEVDERIFRNIAEMPFHLVISINPDNYLSDVCYKYGIKHRFNYFQFEGTAVAEVEEPTKETPLIYNLCGYKEKDASLVLDYDDLFRLMKAIFGTPGLPEKLRMSLENTKTFICLGFDFEKWHTQLLLRILSGKKGKKIKKYVMNRDITDDNAETFLINQFGITFLGDDDTFFNELNSRAKTEGYLRTLSGDISAKHGQVIRLLSQNQLLAAFDILQKKLTGDDLHALTMLSSRYHNIEEAKKKGTIDMRDYFVQFNQIIDAILELTKPLAL